MKIEQNKTKFKPITITLETAKEAIELWEMVDNAETSSSVGNQLRRDISNWFSETAAIMGIKDE